MMSQPSRQIPFDLQEFVATGTDDRGQPTGSWLTLGVVWGRVQTLNGRALESARQVYTLATVQIHARYTPNITKERRLLFSGQVYPIGWVDNVDQRNHECRILSSPEAT